MWLYPTKSTGYEEVLKKFNEWSVIFVTPTRVVTDRGSAYTSKAFEEYMIANGIEHVLSTTGVARDNGQIERVNRSILSITAKLSSD